MISHLSELVPNFLASLVSRGLSNQHFCGRSRLCSTKQYNFAWSAAVNIDPIGQSGGTTMRMPLRQLRRWTHGTTASSCRCYE
jgi:hypothetical protein